MLMFHWVHSGCHWQCQSLDETCVLSRSAEMSSTSTCKEVYLPGWLLLGQYLGTISSAFLVQLNGDGKKLLMICGRPCGWQFHRHQRAVRSYWNVVAKVKEVAQKDAEYSSVPMLWAVRPRTNNRMSDAYWHDEEWDEMRWDEMIWVVSVYELGQIIKIKIMRARVRLLWQKRGIIIVFN